MTSPLFEIDALEVAVEDKPIVKALSLTLRPGEVHAIMGPNGSGKSTLANSLMGHPRYTINGGDIRLQGESVIEMAPDERARAGLFLAFQYPTDIPGVSMINFLRRAISARRGEEIPVREYRLLLNDVLGRLQMDEQFVRRYVNDGFSGGEKKRAEILQLGLLQPLVAVMDETDSGLDIDALRIVSEGINTFHSDDNAILLITHYQRILRYVKPDHVHVLIDGRIVESGDASLAERLERDGYEPFMERTTERGVELMTTPAAQAPVTAQSDYEFGFHDDVEALVKLPKGLSREVVNTISDIKDEPEWMRKLRLKALDHFNARPMPEWGGELGDIDFNDIHYYVRATDRDESDWEDVPDYIKDTYDKLGIPEAEKQGLLAGVGAQYDSEVVYHNIREDLEEKGVLFLGTDQALREYPDLVKEYFTTVIPANDNKFAALNTAVWSGGSFIYVPPGVKVDIPLQAYFRINSEDMGQFERTLIIADEGAEVHYVEGCTAPIYSSDSLHSAVVEIVCKAGSNVRYTTIQNWSNNVYNLVTKRAMAYRDAVMTWVDGNLGSKLTMKYPAVYLMEPGAHGEVLSIASAGQGQQLDAGAKIVHAAPDTTSVITSKSLSMDGGRSTYRGLLKVYEGAENCRSNVRCDALMLDEHSRSDTYPVMEIDEKRVDIGHEATVSKVGDEQLFYLMARGLSEGEATKMIVNGFVEPIIKSLPLEYAVEMNRLIELQMDGAHWLTSLSVPMFRTGPMRP